MSGDVLQLLRAVDPVLGTPATYSAPEINEKIGQAKAAGSRPAGRGQISRASAARRVLVVGTSTVALAALGLGTAVATGWINPDVREAFYGAQEPTAPGHDPTGARAQADTTREVLAAPGPEGSHMTAWDSSVGVDGVCYSIIVDTPSAEIFPGSGKPFHQGSTCGNHRLHGTFDTYAPFRWRSPRTGRLFTSYLGVAGTAPRIEIRIPGKPSLTAVIGNGYFLVGPLPEEDRANATLVAVDADGRLIPVFGRLGSSLADPVGPG